MLVTVGTSLGVPLVALALSGLLILHHLAVKGRIVPRDLTKVLTTLFFVSCIVLILAVILSEPQTVPKKKNQPPEEEVGLWLELHELGSHARDRTLLIDIRDGQDRYRGYVPGTVHLEIENVHRGLIHHGPEDRVIEMGALRAASLFEHQRRNYDQIALFCYGGPTAKKVAQEIRGLGVSARVIREGWIGARKVLPVRRKEFREELRIRRIPPGTADRWHQEGHVKIIHMSDEDMVEWMKARELWPSLSEQAEGFPLVIQPAGAWQILLAASRLREEGHAPLAWVDSELGESGTLKGAMASTGRALEEASGAGWWLVLVLVVLVWSFFLNRRELRSRLTGRTDRVSARLALTGQVASLIALNYLARGAAAWSGSTLGFLVNFGGPVLPVIITIGVWFQLAQPRRLRLDALERSLRRRWLPNDSKQTSRWIWRWYHPLIGMFASALLYPLPVPTIYASAILLWMVPLVEDAWVAWTAIRVSSARNDSVAVGRLLRAAGLKISKGNSDLAVRTFSPGHPGRISFVYKDVILPVGLFTGKVLVKPENDRMDAIISEESIRVTADSSVRAAVAAGWDLEVEWNLERGPRIVSFRLIDESSPEREDDSWLLHRQLMAAVPWLKNMESDGEPVLSGKRYEEAVEKPTPLTFDCLAARLDSSGGAGEAARRFGVNATDMRVVRFGARIYDVVGGRPSGSSTRMVLRLTVRAFLMGAARTAQKKHLPETLARLSVLSGNSLPAARDLRRALEQLSTRSALFPEQLSVAVAVAADEVLSLGRVAQNCAGSESPTEPGTLLNAREWAGSPYELMPEHDISQFNMPVLPLILPDLESRASTIGSESSRWGAYWRFAERMRTWTRSLYIAETACLGYALARFGEHVGVGNDIFYLKRTEVFELLRGKSQPRDRAGERRKQLEQLGRLDLSVEFSHADLEALTVDSEFPSHTMPATDTPVLNGEPVAGRFPVRGIACSSFDGSTYSTAGKVVIVPRFAPHMVPWCRNAAAVIAEQGGRLSHAAVLARELGLPTILGAKGAMRQLADGDWVILHADGCIETGEPPDCSSLPGPLPLWMPLSEVSDMYQAGGKAAVLSRLHAAGVRVPGGTVLTVEAFKRMLTHLSVEAPPAGDPGDPPPALNPRNLPPELDDALEGIWTWFEGTDGTDELIVRSSALIEDGSRYSFAGLFTSVAGVYRPDQLRKKVCDCWRSAWSPALSAYARAIGVRDRLFMGLVIQHRIAAEMGGCC